MSDSYDFRTVTHFTAGAQGRPGQRVFYLQVGDELSHVSVKIEKQQVQALAQFLRSVLDDLPVPQGADDTKPAPLLEPAVPEWVVGQIAVGVAEADAEVVLVVDELVTDDEQDGGESDSDEVELDLLDPPPGGGRIRAHIKVEQAMQFVAASDELMSKGRPPCRLCGQPVDPSGHPCPRLN